MLTEVTPSTWIDLDEIRWVCLAEDEGSIKIGMSNDYVLAIQPDGDVSAAALRKLAARIVKLVRLRDEPENEPVRRPLS